MFWKAAPVLLGYGTPAFLPAVNFFYAFNSSFTASMQSGLFQISLCREKPSHKEQPAVPKPDCTDAVLFVKHFPFSTAFKTAEGKAGLQAPMKNDLSLPKPFSIILLRKARESKNLYSIPIFDLSTPDF
ncbi:hypothetical protein OQX63_21905 [Pedobacter sp. PF22-3]|uniref:hypothetical protein n=1 Tax=Pedobacter sp. PF22-3 TaxID=2994467 RepID=UPI002247B156|nr:hypothetical protein [Pedobacter sp. PF22-3]MCX2496166.1 hypothetical protein [Pedobacter sp. PF22-3]